LALFCEAIPAIAQPGSVSRVGPGAELNATLVGVARPGDPKLTLLLSRLEPLVNLPPSAAVAPRDLLAATARELAPLSLDELRAMPPERVEALASRIFDRVQAQEPLVLGGASPDYDALARETPWGPRLFASASSQKRRLKDRVQDRLFAEMLSDPQVKKRTIAFLDVAVGAKPQALKRLLKLYFPAGIRAPGLLGLLVAAGRVPFMPRALVAWGTHAAIASMSRRFLAGENTSDALDTARRLGRDGLNVSLDVVQERVVSRAEADRYTAAVIDLIGRWSRESEPTPQAGSTVPVRHISIKMSALTSRFDPIAAEQVHAEAGDRLFSIFQEAYRSAARGAPVLVNVDLEEDHVADLTYDILWSTLAHPSLDGFEGAGVVVQAYRQRSRETLLSVIAHARSLGKRIQIRVVKGAYHRYEQINAARKGWPTPVFLTQAETDASYAELLRTAMLNERFVRVAAGTHNLRDVALVQALRERLRLPPSAVEHQFLLGVGEGLARAVASFGIPARLYAPFGDAGQALGYLVRRLDEVTPDSAIGQSRLSGTWLGYLEGRRKRWEQTARAQPLRQSSGFRNEPETDFSKPEEFNAMRSALERRLSQATPPPAPASPQDISAALARAERGYRIWSSKTQPERSAVLRRAAALARARKFDLAAQIVMEARKPWKSAVADVEEGIDFLEAYARDGLTQSPRRAPLGVGVAISPFNYPFAIAIGMLSGGLALGNAMILKPAEQTPLTGALVVDLLREAGVPTDAVALLTGGGEDVGRALVESPRVDFIAFTGSKATADKIVRSAALHPPARGAIKVVAAETGGKNALIVDETADLDVAVDAILSGGCEMGGQRCSATSRVIAVASVYDALLRRLASAAGSMTIGLPTSPASQVTPLIDETAAAKARRYIELAGRDGAAVFPAAGSAPASDVGTLISPRIFVSPDPASPAVQEEIFAPILVVQEARDFDDALRLANGVDFGLTGALISRDPENIRRFQRAMEAGNTYVNRAQVGARVGEQPFGGAKASGTGPQAGGPHYVARFGRPRRSYVSQGGGSDDLDSGEAFPFSPAALLNLQKSWKNTTVVERVGLLNSLRGALRAREAAGPAKGREWRRSRMLLSSYAERIPRLLAPQRTNDLPGEINTRAHDWPLGTGLIWTENERLSDAIAAAAAAVAMGNTVVVGDDAVGRGVARVFAEAGAPVGLVAVVGNPGRLLGEPWLLFAASHGRSAAAVARRLLSAPALPGAFRRFIGATDSPDDAGYLTRFAHARTRTERTLRHGADLDLTAP
jgi:RHH-type proline utilization regulon transcriptional repressor/proline dehydrogenase/delta 1-pyrroline-5-carboxylate dehydrogenase